MSPAPLLVGLLAAWTMLGLLPIGWPALRWSWLALGGVLLVFAALDAYRIYTLTPPSAVRRVEPILALGVWSNVYLRLANTGAWPCRVTVFDHYLQPAEVADLPQTVQLASAGWTELHYRLRPVERGARQFGPTQVLIDSPLRLWRRNFRLGKTTTVKVYPNFANIAKFTLLASHNRVSAMGIHKRRRRGEGQDFYQLREYRPGDSLRQLDWKATSRMHKLIAKEYQEERNQPLVFLLDCSRRMRARDGTLSHFDHALNAMILLTYVALRQGDAVGVYSFGGAERWQSPKQGKHVLNRVVNAVYDLQPTIRPADYGLAASRFLARQHKRTLVVILSNLGDENSGDLAAAIRLLGRRHVVLVANLRESVLDDTLARPLHDFRQAQLYAATCHYLIARERCQQEIRHQGGIVLDAQPKDLPVAIVNHYFDIKRSGRL